MGLDLLGVLSGFVDYDFHSAIFWFLIYIFCVYCIRAENVSISSEIFCKEARCMNGISYFALAYYREEVFQVEWDPNHETVLASSADDRRLMVWDLNRYLITFVLSLSCVISFFII